MNTNKIEPATEVAPKDPVRLGEVGEVVRVFDPSFDVARDGCGYADEEAVPGNVGILAITTILVPLQFDARSRLLLIMASSLAAQLQAGLVLLHVYEKKTYVPSHTSAKQFEENNLTLRRQAEAKMAGLKASFGGITAVRDARSLVTDGDLEVEIPRIAVAINASMVLLSSHAYSGLKRLLFGSKADAILRRSPCPVLVIPDVPLFEGLEQIIEVSRPKGPARSRSSKAIRPSPETIVCVSSNTLL